MNLEDLTATESTTVSCRTLLCALIQVESNTYIHKDALAGRPSGLHQEAYLSPIPPNAGHSTWDWPRIVSPQPYFIAISIVETSGAFWAGVRSRLGRAAISLCNEIGVSARAATPLWAVQNALFSDLMAVHAIRREYAEVDEFCLTRRLRDPNFADSCRLLCFPHLGCSRFRITLGTCSDC